MKCVYKMNKQELLNECLRLRKAIQDMALFDENTAPDSIKADIELCSDSKYLFLFSYLRGKLQFYVDSFGDDHV